MISYRALFYYFFVFLFSQSYGQGIQQRIEVTADGHFLQHEDGTPFFWLGDTAWELFHRLNSTEIDQYLENRSRKGFNVIQAVLLPEMDGLRIPNLAGELPLHNGDPEQPNEAYFRLVDTVVQHAREKGLYLALLPTWGDKVTQKWGVGPVVFNEKNAYSYGLFLGKRYSRYPNILWIIGGDRPAVEEGKDYRPIWRAMVKGLREGTKNKILITYHPWGEYSSTSYWANEKTLDIHMMQSGHGRKDIPVQQWIIRDYQLGKPVLDGEPCYEDHPIAFDAKNGYFRDLDVRRRVYHSVFAGACGVTYGHHAIWQFYRPGIPKTTFADRYWKEALDRPGAFQMGYLKQLIENVIPEARMGDTTIVQDDNVDPEHYVSVLKSIKGDKALVYLPDQRSVTLDLSWMSSKRISQQWFNPISGEISKARISKRNDRMKFSPLLSTADQDWVLIVIGK